MPDNIASKATSLDTAVQKLLDENPHLRDAISIFDISIEQYERLLVATNPPETATSNITTIRQ